MKTLVLYAHSHDSHTLSYNDDWLEAFEKNKNLHVKTQNLITTPTWKLLPQLFTSEAVVCLHSVYSNQLNLNRKILAALKYRRGKLIFFVGNEFKLMPEKIELMKSLEPDLIVSQLPQDTAEWLYEECKKSRVLSLAHALNPDRFRPQIPWSKRDIDIGARSFDYTWYLGDRDRREIMQFVEGFSQSLNLKTDISTSPSSRLPPDGWARFLNQCRTTVSTEAGTSFLERDDRTRHLVNDYQKMNPDASFEEVYKKYFETYQNPISGKCVSSRHFDAIGTKTCQIMFEGRFNDTLKAGEHYIKLARDFRNAREVFEQIQDVSFVQKMVDQTYEYACASHTHQHRIATLLGKLDDR